jgi:hypothetical protein
LRHPASQASVSIRSIFIVLSCPFVRGPWQLHRGRFSCPLSRLVCACASEGYYWAGDLASQAAPAPLGRRLGNARGRRVLGWKHSGPPTVLTLRDGPIRPCSPNFVEVVFSASRFEDREWTILGRAGTPEKPDRRTCAVCDPATRRMSTRRRG